MGLYLKVHGLGTAADQRADGLGEWVEWNESIHGTQEQVEAQVEEWAQDYLRQVTADQAAAQQAGKDKSNRRATLQSVRDGSGSLTADQLTAVMRLLLREVFES